MQKVFSNKQQATAAAAGCRRLGDIAVIVECPGGYLVRSEPWNRGSRTVDWGPPPGSPDRSPPPPSSQGNGPQEPYYGADRRRPKMIRGRWNDRSTPFRIPK